MRRATCRAGLRNAALSMIALTIVGCSGGSGSPRDGGADLSGEGGADSSLDGCPGGMGTGQGRVDFLFTGLPAGATGTVEVNQGTAAPSSNAPYSFSLKAGSNVVRASRIAVADPVARTIYEPMEGELKGRTICVAAGENSVITIRYAPVASSNKLWAGNLAGGGSSPLSGFNALSVVSGGLANASVRTQTGGSGVFAFDVSGNVWTTNEAAWLVRHPAAALATSGVPLADSRIEPDAVSGGFDPAAMAFDVSGGLWLSLPSSQTVIGFSPQQLASAMPVPSTVLSVMGNPLGLAFDPSGNLWVASTGVSATLLRFDAGRLSGSSLVPDLTVKVGGTAARESPSAVGLAFDSSGNLWVNDGQALVSFKPEQVNGMGSREVVPAVEISVEVVPRGESIAFDESGGLWFPYGHEKLARLSATQLGSSGTKTPERVIESTDLGDVHWLAIYPAPAALPLYHRLP